MQVANDQARERGSTLVVVLLVTLLLLLLGTVLLGTSETETVIAANDYWSEGAFQAADAAVHAAVDGLDAVNQDQVVELRSIGDLFQFRSGGREDGEPQPPQFVSKVVARGYAIADGSGYRSSGYARVVYQVNGTGMGPRNSVREVEVQVEIGPVQE